ncbi:non-ribosomal peptide synthetase [Endothiovibrio diazotrophicus]
MRPLEDLLADLARRDIRLTANGANLRFDAPPGAMDDAVREEIKARKGEILAFLAAGEGVIPPAPPAARYPLSFAQRRLWYLWRLAPANPFYNAPTVLELRGALDEAALRGALDALVARHEVLRSVYADGGEGEPMQEVRPALPLAMALHDLRELSPEARAERLTALAEAEARAPFDLAADPMLRALLARTAADTWVLMLTLHHIVSDGWSIGILVRELQALYGGEALAPPAIQYRDFAVWQRATLSGPRLEALVEHWRRRLEGAPTRLPLVADRAPGEGAAAVGGAAAFRLAGGVQEALHALARGERATLFMLLATAYAALLGRYTGSEELLVGAAIANRTRQELEGLIGLFVNTVPLRADLSGDPSFRTLLRRLRGVALEAFERQELPFDVMVSELQPEREALRTPLVQAVLVVQNAPAEAWSLPGVTVRPLPLAVHTARNDLELHMWEDAAGLAGILYYDAGRFEEATVRHMAGHLERIIEAMAVAPDGPALGTPLISPEEQRRLLAVDAPPPPAEPVTALIAAAVAARPRAVALERGAERVTYGELASRSAQVARALAARGLARGAVVGLWMEASPEAIVAILGCWRAGVAYLPLSLGDPLGRIAELVEDGGVRLLVTGAEVPDGAPKGVPMATLAELLAAPADSSAEPAPPAAETLAYLLYTSGSSGRPKGVEVTHRGLANLARELASAYRIGPRSRVLLFAPLTFDASVGDIVAALGCGATLCVEPRAAMAPGEPLAALLRDKAITVAVLPPSILGVLPETELPALATLVTVGEACPPALARAWGRGRHFVNGYGPTENSVCSTVHVGGHRAPPDALRIPIGRPIGNVEAWLLDARGRPVPPGMPGELHLGGVGLARGYLGRPEESAARFRPHPFAAEPGARLYASGDLARYDEEGVIEFLGRVDQQVKLRGMRVELGEIEGRLWALPEVREAAVVVAGDTPEQRRLAAFVVPAAEVETGAAAALVREWHDLFEALLERENEEGEGDALFNHQGWIRSDGGDPFSEAEMRAWCRDVSEEIVARRPAAVLEIGCGTGMLLFAIAPHCARYRGIDLSARAVDYVRRQVAACAPRFDHVECAVGSALDPPGVEEGGFDVVLLHSVIQYFPDPDYLRAVIERALRALRPGGALVLGDVRNLALHRVLESALVRAGGEGEPALLRERVRARMAREQELLVDPGFFLALAADHPRLGGCRFRLQGGAVANELNRYRYTAILESAPLPPPVTPLDGRGLGIAELAAHLRAAAPETVAWSGLANALLAPELAADAALFGEEWEGGAEGVTPEALYALAGELGYRAEVSWARDPGDGRLDVLFHRGQGAPPTLPLSALGRTGEPGALVNEPVAPRRAVDLAKACRHHLREHLPAHMVPPLIEVRDALPLNAHGKVDRRRLAAEAARRAAPARAAGEGLQGAVAALFAEVLGLPEVAAEEDFFRLGGHSLLAVTLAERISRHFGTSLSIAALIAAPTPAAVAARLVEAGVGTGAAPTGGSDPASPWLLHLGGGGAGAPLFLLPPVAGSPLCYLDFATALAWAGPVWGLQCPGLRAGEVPLASVEALGERFVAAMRSVQPRGPYRVAGWSYGGLLAVEVATRLAGEGEAVAFVGLLDSATCMPPTPPARGLAALRRVARRAFELVVGFPLLIAQVGPLRGYQDLRRLAQAAGIVLPGSAKAMLRATAWRDTLRQGARGLVLFRRNLAAATAYVPRSYGGPLTLLRAAVPQAGDPIVDDVNARSGGRARVRYVSGSHMSMMLDPRGAARIAAIVADELAESGRTVAAGGARDSL